MNMNHKHKDTNIKNASTSTLTFQPAVKQQMFSGGQITPQHIVLRADPHRLMNGLQFGGVGDGISVHEGVSVAGFKQPAQHGDGGGFAGAVGALWERRKGRRKEGQWFWIG